RGLGALGHAVAVRPLRLRTGFHTLDRYLYNAGARLVPPAGDVVVGVDLDGFLWARRRPRPRFIVMLKGVIADEARNGRGLLRARIPGVQIRIVGDGPESRHLRALHAELGLGDAAVLLGQVSRAQLAVEYVSALCFCLPTVQEGFGLVFAEAMAAGLPVVACRAAAVPEIVEDRRTGFLVTPRSPGELATALETLLTNTKLSEDFGRAATQRVEAFGLEPVARRFLEALP